MAESECIKKVSSLFPDMEKESLRRLEKQLTKIAKDYSDNLSELRKLKKKAVDDFQVDGLREARSRVLAKLKERNNIKHVVQKGFLGNKVEGVLSLFEGTTHKVKNKFKNVATLVETEMTDSLNELHRRLEAAGMKGGVISGEFDDEIIVEYFNRSKKGHVSNVPKKISDAVDAFEDINKYIVKKEQDAGSSIVYRPGRIFQQIHDKDKILENVDEWVNYITERLDLEESFGINPYKTGLSLEEATESGDEVRKILTDIAQNMGDNNGGPSFFKGGKQVFNFKDGLSLLEYNKKYGQDNLFAGVEQTIRSASRRTAMVEIFGNDPVQGLNNLKKSIGKIEGTAFESLDGDRTVDTALDYFRGKGNSFMNEEGWGAKAYETIRGVKVLNMFRFLGKTGASSLNDITSTLAVLKTTSGKNMFAAFAEGTFEAISSAVGGGRSLNDIMKAYNIGLEDISREMFETYGSSTYQPGKMSRAIETYMNINLASPVTRLTRKTGIRMVLKELDNMLGVPLSSMNQFQRQTIDAIGLTELDIKTLNKVKDATGTGTVDPGILRLAKDDLFDIPPGKKLDSYRKELINKLSNFANEKIREVSPLAGAKEFRRLKRNLPKDSKERLIYEILGEFKGTVLKSQSVAVETIRTSNNGGKLMAIDNMNTVNTIAQMMIFGTAVNYTLEYLKAKISNRDLPEPSVGEITKHFIGSGMAGVGLDFLYSNVISNDYGRMPSPILSDIKELSDFVRNEDEKAATAKNFLINLEMTNLWLIEAWRNHILKEGVSRTGDF